MQGIVEKILEGNFKRDVHCLEFSEPAIELSLREGESYEGSFTITGPENEMSQGSVSSTRLRMHCLVSRFSGQKEEIPYHFDASGMEEGDSLNGEFRIISNQGEYFVPYHVAITQGTIDSELRDIRNLFHFANLARTNWQEAVKLFYSRDFARVFTGADRQYHSLYRGLSQGAVREQNVEEFLLEIKKKQKMEFLLEEAEIRMDNPKDMTEGKLVINRNGWGYSELFIETDGDFIVLEKEVIRDEDFLGNCYRLPFYVSAGRLHAGRNYGEIRLTNPYVSLTARVTVVNKTVAARVPGVRRQKKHKIMELMQYYEAFRTKKISASSWMKETGELIEELVHMDERDLAVKLFQAQFLITSGRANEAEWILGQADKELEEHFDATLYCYYLYLNTLISRKGVYIDETAGQVERIFAQNSDNWRIAWLLLYLSEDYTRSASKRWIVLEEQFRQGCTSPVLYIEAWNLLLANPTLLMRLGSFEIQILSYAAKKDLLTVDIINQSVYLAQKQKNYSGRLFFILKACYKVMPTDEILQTICTLLIKGNITAPFSFPWYEKGIEKELRITRLYEYYMMSIPLTDDRELPRMVLMYFAFDSSLDSLHNAFLYAYVHKVKGQYPELYENYREQIERFVVSQVLKGRNNQYLAYLYKNLFTPFMITEETAKGLSTALFMHRLRVKRKSIRNVVLVYEKEKKETVCPVTGTEAYIPVYSDDCRLLLEDKKGNRFCREEEYELERLMAPEPLCAAVGPYVTGCVHLDIWLCGRGSSLSEITPENAEYMKRLADSTEVIEEVRREIRMRLIDFFFDNDRMRELDDALEELSPEQIENRCFSKVLQFLVVRGMYEKAFAWMKLRGAEGIDAKLILRLCTRLLAIEGIVEDETMTLLAFRAFKAGKYDGNLLEYLCRFFTGTCMEMRDIWKAADSFGVDSYHLGGRILVQTLYTGAYVAERAEIFKRYVAGGAGTEVELAVLAQCSYDYFVLDKPMDEFVLEDMQRVIERQEENFPLVCRLAYTRYYAENKKIVDERISRCLLVFLREILAQNKYFPYFKEYADNIVFMRQFLDKTMVEYRIREGGAPVIHYLIEKEDTIEGEYIKEEMQDMFGGVYVRQFILFFGEHLQYYITEKQDGKEHLMTSGTLSRNDTGREQKESRYDMLNDIAVGRNLQDYDTMESQLYEYFEKDYLVKELFHMI